VSVRLYDDMAPFHFQIEAAWHHAVWGWRPRRPAYSSRRAWSDRSRSPNCGP
jgi:hypothetical protein